jgi:hypothetical protein
MFHTCPVYKLPGLRLERKSGGLWRSFNNQVYAMFLDVNTSQSLSADPWAHEQSGHAGRIEFIQWLSKMDFHSSRPTWV